ncbi:hypothetical protein [Aquihabitans sp. McL0605]|uniref:hypothetical protein n=1 Tax=Aquihabitans sp. McL0605 TaxID=3415671 RepID=UPI003CEA7AD9
MTAVDQRPVPADVDAGAGADGQELPVLALLAAPGTTSRAVPLLGLLGIHARVVSWQRRGDVAPDAVIVTSVDSLRALHGSPPIPTAVWVKHHEHIDEAIEAGATLLLTARPELMARGAVLVPPIGIEVDRWPAAAPLVRRRRREQRGLPAVHVVKLEPGMDPTEAEIALSVASAAVVSGPATLLGLALGTPLVTSTDTARRLGVRPGRDVEVAAGPEQALELAAEIAADDARAASLSRRARRCAEHHLDLGRPALVVAQRLGLVATPAGPIARIDGRLDELATPIGSPVRARVDDALAGFPADGGGSSA